MLTTAQVAALHGHSVRRVQARIMAGELPAMKVGRDWLVSEEDAEKFRPRAAGRPKAK